MRLWSTTDSSRQGEPSLLAILETLAAMATSVWIGVHYHTWIHVVVGFCIAPFLLLRTDESCEQGLRWFKRGSKRVEEVNEYLQLPYYAFGTPPIRLLSTVASLLRNPSASLLAVPGNWWRMACATDFAVSPEALPHPVNGSDHYPALVRDPETVLFSRPYSMWRGITSNLWEEMHHEDGGRGSILFWGARKIMIAILLAVIQCLVFALPITLAAVAYRWSIKSTALGWFPLLWALKPSRPKDRDWKTHLAIEAELKKPQLVATWSFLCLAILGLKYGLWAIRHDLASNVEAWRSMFQQWGTAGGWRGNIANSPLAEALVNFVRPGAIPLWQLGILFNSILGIFIWWRIRQWNALYKYNAPPTDVSIQRTLSVTFFFRHLLTSYVIVCDGYMALQVARNLPLPEIGQKLFPWL